MTPIHCFRTFFRRRILAAGFFVVASTATSWAQTGSIAAPTFSEPTGTYTKEVHVRISDATNGVSLYYTTNGTTPTASSPPVPGKTIEFKGTTTLEAIAILGGVSSSVTSATYTFSGTGGTTVATPMFSPGAGTYASAQAVTISDSTNGASIYYTTNGTAPTTSSTVYRGPISIGSGTVTIEAMAALSGDLNSAVATAAYTIGAPPPPVVATPTFSPGGGSYPSAQDVTIASVTSGASIRYTTDGSTPSETNGTLYSGPVYISSTAILQAVAYKSGLTDSALAAATYTIGGVGSQVATPTFSAAGGTYQAGIQIVTISTATSGASIIYTLDGSTPTENNGIGYPGQVTVYSTATLKAIAYKSGLIDSDVASATYTIALGDTYEMSHNMPPRDQWENNYGYCGEVAFQMAGLYYGQYLSQYDARSAATPGVKQNKSSSQLLPAVNDQVAAANMHLNCIPWNYQTEKSSEDYLAWVKGYLLQGYPVVICLYMNMYLFNGSTGNTSGGASDYDHIVMATGIASNHPLSGASASTYYPDDIITFSDSGVYADSIGPETYSYIFSYDFGPFQLTRAQANLASSPPYSTSNYANSNAENAGDVITGVIDDDHETVPVRVDTNPTYEDPPMADGATARPAAEPMVLTITVSGLTPGVTYNLYRYNALTSVPNSAFNANAANAYEKWSLRIASGSTYVMTENIMSNEVAAYRAVPASAP
jgi:hypothetical protein